MRRALLIALPLLMASCALLEPSGRRFAVFFSNESAVLDDGARQVLAGAADYARAHPDRAITVEGFADPTTPGTDTGLLISTRVAEVAKGLVANGVVQSQINRESGGTPKPALNRQESRRVVVTVGNP